MTEITSQPSMLFIFPWIYLAKRTSLTSPFIITRMTAPSDLSGAVLASSAPSVTTHSSPFTLKNAAQNRTSPKSPRFIVESRPFYWNLKHVCLSVWEVQVVYTTKFECNMSLRILPSSFWAMFFYLAGFFWLSQSFYQTRSPDGQFFGCPVTGESKLVSAWQQYVET